MINRREFIGKAAGALAAASVLGAGEPVSALTDNSTRRVAPSDQVNLGIIGPGSRGQGDMRSFLRVPGVRFTALCDVYEPRFAAAQKITGEATPTYTDYRKMLERKDIDAVVIATPLSCHAEEIYATLDSGRHIYGEKDMAKTVDECNRVVDAVKKSGKHYQIGLQYHYAPWFREALAQVRAGKIGEVTHIYSYWHRNSSWRRPVPDPKDVKLERLINWRMYREYSGGLLAELGTHHMNFVHQIYGAIPQSAVGTGSIVYWKDGREVPDNLQVVFRYADGRAFSFSAITTNRFYGDQICIFGTGGTIVVTEAGGASYYEPATAGSAVPEGLIEEHGVVTGASFRAEVPYTGPSVPIEGPQGLETDANYIAASSFIDCVRNNKRPDADERVGWAAGISIALGNQAIDSGTTIKFADHVKPLAV